MSNGLNDFVKEKIKTEEGFRVLVAEKLIQGEEWMAAKDADCEKHKERTNVLESWKDRVFGAWSAIAVFGGFTGAMIIYLIDKWSK